MRDINNLVKRLQARREQCTRKMIILIVICLLAFVGNSLAPALLGHTALQQKRYELQQEVKRRTETNRQLQQEIEALQSDPQFIEKSIRRELHAMAPGEYKLESMNHEQ